MRRIAYLILVLALSGSVAYSAAESLRIPVLLGDSDRVVNKKMREIGARDVTKKTRFKFYGAYRSKQKYYWWELIDHTVTGILLVGESESTLEVVTIEIGEPGKGVEGIKIWRTQKLTSIQK